MIEESKFVELSELIDSCANKVFDIIQAEALSNKLLVEDAFLLVRGVLCAVFYSYCVGIGNQDKPMQQKLLDESEKLDNLMGFGGRLND